MKISHLPVLLLALSCAFLSPTAIGAEPVRHEASAAPGASPDANEDAVEVWTVREGDTSANGFTDEAGNQGVWQIFDAGGPGPVTQTHRFAGGALAEGQAVSIDYAHGANINPGKILGLRFLDAAGETQLEVAFVGGEGGFIYSDASATGRSTGQEYNPRDFMRLSLRVTGATTYEASFNGHSWTGALEDPVAQIQVFNDHAGANSDQYTDNLVISERQSTPIERQAQIGEGAFLFVPQGYDPARTPSFAFAESPTEQAEIRAEPKLIPEFFIENDEAGAALAVPEGTSLYGTGEVMGPLLRNGESITLWNTDNYLYEKADGRRLYQSHPWVLGVRPDGSAFGVLFDTTWKATLRTDDKRIVFESEGAPFRIAVIDRPSPQAVVRGLADLTGKMPLPPKWAMGFHQCRYSYYPDSQVRKIADEFRRRKLPCDVIWMDIHYMDEFRVFTFDREHFPDPKATNGYLHAHNFHSVWMIDPGVKKDPGYAVYDTGTRKDLWVQTREGRPFVGKVWPGDCVFPDFTMPATRQWWAQLYRDFIATGVDGVWNDMNEPAVFESSELTMPEDNWHRGGGDLPPGPHRLYHNVYGMLMAKASQEGILQARPDRRPFVLTRANHLGGHRYAATWTGDNGAAMSYLEVSIPMSLNLGLSGQPMSGPDIGGYAGEITPELFGKWIAMAPFYPFSRAHTAVDNPPREPWVFGPEIEEVSRTALERRYRLLPYLYTLAHRASTQGDPIMQPVFFADPGDPKLRAEDGAFLLGPDLLVVPQWVTDAKLPQGIWRETWLVDPAREQDGYQATVRIRGGAIVPLGKVIQHTGEESLDPLTLLVCLDESGQASGELYEDAGDGFGYVKGDYALTRYRATREGEEVRVKVESRTGNRAVLERQIKVRVVTGEGVLEGSGSESEALKVEATSSLLHPL